MVDRECLVWKEKGGGDGFETFYRQISDQPDFPAQANKVKERRHASGTRRDKPLSRGCHLRSFVFKVGTYAFYCHAHQPVGQAWLVIFHQAGVE